MSGGITTSTVTAYRPTLLYSMSSMHGVPNIIPGVHSTFRTSDGQSIPDIKTFTTTLAEAGGRFSNVTTIADRNKHPYVVKHLKYHYSPDRALREVQNLIKCLGNPQVVQILGAEIYSTEAFIVCKYVPGKTLLDYINQKPPPHREEVIRRYAETANAIYNLHEQGLVHLDINPKNVWVPDDPHSPTILLDLGSMHGTGEERNFISGTPGYYPRFANLGKADPKLNLYGMGSILMKHPPAFPLPEPDIMAGMMASGGAGASSHVNLTNVTSLTNFYRQGAAGGAGAAHAAHAAGAAHAAHAAGAAHAAHAALGAAGAAHGTHGAHGAHGASPRRSRRTRGKTRVSKRNRRA